MSGLFNTTAFRIIEQGINIAVENSKIISHNITNSDTPGYKCKYLYFEGILRDKIDAKENAKYKKELNLGTAVYTDENTKGQPDGNNVDNDTQNALFAKNQIYYNTLITQINSELNLLRSAMRKN